MLIANLAIASAIVPIGGSLLLARTYRTDPHLQSLAVPKVTILTHAVATACAFLLMARAPSIGWPLIAAMIFGPMFAIALLTDAAGRVLPDFLTAALALAGLALAIAGLGLPIADALAGMIAMAGGLWLLRRLFILRHGADAFGLGDVKLMTASAAIMPFQQIAWSVIFACLLAVPLVFWRGFRPAADPSLPFGSLFVGGLALLTITGPALPGFGA